VLVLLEFTTKPPSRHSGLVVNSNTVTALWLRIVTQKLEKSPHFAPSLENFMTCHKQSAPDDQHRTTVHHSCDPLGAGEMDQQVLACHCG
jgi:hypothetical protein